MPQTRSRKPQEGERTARAHLIASDRPILKAGGYNRGLYNGYLFCFLRGSIRLGVFHVPFPPGFPSRRGGYRGNGGGESTEFYVIGALTNAWRVGPPAP